MTLMISICLSRFSSWARQLLLTMLELLNQLFTSFSSWFQFKIANSLWPICPLALFISLFDSPSVAAKISAIGHNIYKVLVHKYLYATFSSNLHQNDQSPLNVAMSGRKDCWWTQCQSWWGISKLGKISTTISQYIYAKIVIYRYWIRETDIKVGHQYYDK